MKTTKAVLALCAVLILLAACSSKNTPQLIASYPSEGKPAIQPSSQYVYDAYLELEVSNSENSASRAESLALQYGGYLVSSQSWEQDERLYITQVLAVPAAQFDLLHGALQDLGKVKNDQVSGYWTGDGWNVYSQITVNFRPRPSAWPDFPRLGWKPGQTFSNAFQVFLTIFGFLADILIWAVVVGGPFVLMALGLRALLRKLRVIGR